MTTAVIPSVPITPAGMTTRRQTRSRTFYVGLSVLLFAMVVFGFWPSYFGPLVRGAADRPWILHVHGAVFMGWMALLVTQVALVAAGQTRLHRTLGTFGIAYGFLVLAMGLVVSFAAPLMHVRAGEWPLDQAAAFLILPLGDMVLFAGVFGAAVFYRRKPEIHKRLMVLATVTLVFAAVARRVPLGDQPLLGLGVWLSPVFVGMVYDRVTRGSVHPIYILGTALLAIGFARVFVMQSDAWLSIGRSLLATVM